MGDIRRRRCRDRRPAVELGGRGFGVDWLACFKVSPQLGERFDDVASQILGGFEERDNALLSDTVFQRLKLCSALAFLDVLARDRVVLVYQEDQARFLQLDRAVVFHLRYGDFGAVRNVAITIGEDAEIDIRLRDHLQRNIDRLRIDSRQMLHHLIRIKSGAVTTHTHLLAVLRQVPRRARNHHGRTILHIRPLAGGRQLPIRQT
jgi:hypothetical protein